MIVIDLNIYLLLFMGLAGFMTGFGKTTGLNVIGIFTTTMLSMIFPAKEAVGILVLTLLTGDIIAVTYYRRTVVWKHVFLLVPWVLAGILLGYFVLLNVNNDQLKLLLGVMILALNIFQLIRDLTSSRMDQKVPNSVWFTGIMGILAGFTTMIGNVAGAVMSVYLLSRRLPKNEFVGTGAWFYLFVNIIKVPFYIHLGMISTRSLLFDSIAIPEVMIGTFIGIKVLPLIPQQLFKWIILALGTAGAIKLIVPNILEWLISTAVVCVIAGLLAVLLRKRKFIPAKLNRGDVQNDKGKSI